MRKHSIKTTQDILDAVNEENIDNFLKDFELWLKTAIQFRGMMNAIGTLLGEEDVLKDSSFTWNEDGKYGELNGVTVKIVSEKEDL